MDRTALNVVRFVVGAALMLSAGGVLIEGGLSRYAKYGIPPHADWGIIAINPSEYWRISLSPWRFSSRKLTVVAT
jgi:hypothetical protein